MKFENEVNGESLLVQEENGESRGFDLGRLVASAFFAAVIGGCATTAVTPEQDIDLLSRYNRGEVVAVKPTSDIKGAIKKVFGDTIRVDLEVAKYFDVRKQNDCINVAVGTEKGVVGPEKGKAFNKCGNEAKPVLEAVAQYFKEKAEVAKPDAVKTTVSYWKGQYGTLEEKAVYNYQQGVKALSEAKTVERFAKAFMYLRTAREAMINPHYDASEATKLDKEAKVENVDGYAAEFVKQTLKAVTDYRGMVIRPPEGEYVVSGRVWKTINAGMSSDDVDGPYPFSYEVLGKWLNDANIPYTPKQVIELLSEMHGRFIPSDEVTDSATRSEGQEKYWTKITPEQWKIPFDKKGVRRISNVAIEQFHDGNPNNYESIADRAQWVGNPKTMPNMYKFRRISTASGK